MVLVGGASPLGVTISIVDLRWDAASDTARGHVTTSRLGLTSTLTDNWLLQIVAENWTRAVDPSGDSTVMDVGADGALAFVQAPAGALQLLAVSDLLEQLVFADSILVLAGWLDPWRGRSTELDLLLSARIIREFSSDHELLRDNHGRYLDSVCSLRSVAEEHQASMEAWQRGVPRWSGQVINGTAHYLAIAEATNRSYWPHPARARFLRRTLYGNPAARAPLVASLENMVSESRVRLQRALGHEMSVLKLSYALPSVAVLCFAEAREDVTPFHVAMQLREDPAFRALRDSLNSASLHIATDIRGATKAIRELADALEYVERQLHLKPQQSGTIDVQFNTFLGGPVVGLPLPVPSFMKKPIVQPQHTGVLTRLILAGAVPVPELLRRQFGLGNARVLRALELLTRDDPLPLVM